MANNTHRKGKTLWTENPDGEKIELFRAADDRTEAAWIAQRARAESRAASGYDGMVVLYRTNAQSRLFEEIFRRERIPYQVLGAVQFYARKEVKDVLAYLRVAVNHTMTWPSGAWSTRRRAASAPRRSRCWSARRARRACR